MPSIARFHGMTIYIYSEAYEPHHHPHFHVRYNEFRASFLIQPPALLAGSLPRRQLNLILAWAELHGEELEENWRLVEQGRRPRWIEGI
jgi:hypothetical protein